MPNESKLEIVKLDNGLKVPTFNGRFFCSRRDPVKEATAWMKAHQKILQSNAPVIILGAGAGFHLLQLGARAQTWAVELNSEIFNVWKVYNSEVQIPVLASAENLNGTVIEFRPAWAGNETAYQQLAENIRALSKETLLQLAEKKDLWVLAEALKKSEWPEQMEMTVKDIAQLFPVENQTPEARLWRTLREFVA